MEYDLWLKQQRELKKEKKIGLKKNKANFREMIKEKDKFLERKHNEQEELYHHSSIVEAPVPMGINISDDLMYKPAKRNTSSNKSQFAEK